MEDNNSVIFNQHCRFGNLKEVEYLIKYMSPIEIYEGFKSACYYNSPEVVDFLMGSVLEVEPELLKWACHDGYLQLLKILIPYVENNREMLNTGFQLACSNGHLEIATYLLSEHNIDYSGLLVKSSVVFLESSMFHDSPIRDEVLYVIKSIEEKKLLESLEVRNLAVVSKI